MGTLQYMTRATFVTGEMKGILSSYQTLTCCDASRPPAKKLYSALFRRTIANSGELRKPHQRTMFDIYGCEKKFKQEFEKMNSFSAINANTI